MNISEKLREFWSAFLKLLFKHIFDPLKSMAGKKDEPVEDTEKK